MHFIRAPPNIIQTSCLSLSLFLSFIIIACVIVLIILCSLPESVSWVLIVSGSWLLAWTALIIFRSTLQVSTHTHKQSCFSFKQWFFSVKIEFYLPASTIMIIRFNRFLLKWFMNKLKECNFWKIGKIPPCEFLDNPSTQFRNWLGDLERRKKIF